MLVVIAVFAVILTIGRWSYYRYVCRGITKNYYVGDLIGVTLQMVPPAGGRFPASLNAQLAKEAVDLKSSVTPDVWWFGARTVTPFLSAASLTVGHTKDGHSQVAAWLKERRKQFYASQDDRAQKQSESRLSRPTQPYARSAHRVNH